MDGTCAHPSLPSTSPGCSTLPGLEAAFIQPVTSSPRWSPSRSHSTQRSPQLARSHRAGKTSYSPLIPGARNKLRGLERAAEAHAGRAGRSWALTPVARCLARRTLPFSPSARPSLAKSHRINPVLRAPREGVLKRALSTPPAASGAAHPGRSLPRPLSPPVCLTSTSGARANAQPRAGGTPNPRASWHRSSPGTRNPRRLLLGATTATSTR